MHRLLSSRRAASHRRAAGPARRGGLRTAAAVIATTGLTSAGLAALPAAAVASASVSAPRAARAGSAAGSATAPRPAPLPPLSAQRPLAVPRAQQLPAGVRRNCPVPTRAGQMECMSLVRTDTRHYLGIAAGVTPPGYGPAALRQAYNLAAVAKTGGVGQKIAVVNAYDDPNAAADLATYRAQYGLPACNTTTGAGCVTKVNEQGLSSPLPVADPTPGAGWAAETALDLEMVSAICPHCQLLLVEASSAGLIDLGTAESNAVVKLGAKFVSDSWRAQEFPTESYYDMYFNYPGVAVVVAGGEGGYGTGWPATSQYVTTVGGTTLKKDTSVPRGWSETVWSGGGSGCSTADPKPSWQTTDNMAPGGCLNRTQNDVAAVADPQTGVATYDTYKTTTGWSVAGGTSVATPIIASVYALAGTPAPGTYPASYPYQSGSAAGLNDVTSGSNGTCEPARQYLCTGEPGYDGPSGLGTPNGTAAFRSTAAGNVVTLADPGVQDEEAGTPVFLAMHATDSGSGQTLTYSATGLPAGLAIGPSSGDITGTLGSTAGASTVTVTATDGTGAKGSVTFSMVVVQPLTASYHPVAGPVHLGMGNLCMDDAGNHTRNGTSIQIWGCNGTPQQNWTFQPDGNPGGAGTLTINGKCADIQNRGTANGTKVQLYTCDSGANQQWLIDGSSGQLFNPVSGKCLTDPGGSTTNGTQLEIDDCTASATYQAWILPASPVQSGVTGTCMNDPNNATANGSPIVIWACKGYTSEQWTLEPDGTLRINGKCLDVAGQSKLDGALIQLNTCAPVSSQRWSIGPGGELINQNSGRCLDDPGDNPKNGTQLIQSDCYGQAGEIWAVT